MKCKCKVSTIVMMAVTVLSLIFCSFLPSHHSIAVHIPHSLWTFESLTMALLLRHGGVHTKAANRDVVVAGVCAEVLAH